MYTKQIQSGEAIAHRPLSPQNYCIFEETTDAWTCLNCKRRIPMQYTDGVMPFAMCSNPVSAQEPILPIQASPDEVGAIIKRVNRAIATDNESARKDMVYQQVIVAGNKSVGSYIRRIVNRMGIETPPSCSCNGRIRTLDEWGPTLCTAREEFILKWLLEEATKRLLPYNEKTGKRLLHAAIKRATKNVARFETNFANLVYG